MTARLQANSAVINNEKQAQDMPVTLKSNGKENSSYWIRICGFTASG